MFRGKGWFSGGLWKPKNPHSLDHLKYLYHVLSKNQMVTEQNKSLLVETLRSIAEILIWGDQNDSTVFDFFLEKNMLSFFLKIMKQKCGRYVCVQLLQTLNILFENIRNETSLYYLLSNNHVNSIIVHKFDFSDEEVMAYYISFLKTLSLKLNSHTIHFFYNEHTNDFPLYTEAIKFFNHSEKMVRIAVRTLTLNVFKACLVSPPVFAVDDRAMLKFVRDKTAAPYFSNLVWFIGNHVLDLDSCVRKDADSQCRNRLGDLVAEHLDHLHYLNDILRLNIEALNDVLTDHFLKRLLVPLYVYSLTKRRRHSQLEDDRPHVSSVVSLFLLSQVFLIIDHQPLVRQLAHIILNKDMRVFSSRNGQDISISKVNMSGEPEFAAPEVTLENSLAVNGGGPDTLSSSVSADDSIGVAADCKEGVREARSSSISETTTTRKFEDEACAESTRAVLAFSSGGLNITDEEKVEAAHKISMSTLEQLQEEFSLNERPFLEAIFNALECTENDHAALFALCLLYALGHNSGINQDLLDTVLMPTDKSETKHLYNIHLVEKLIKIIHLSCQNNSRVRLATLEMSILLLKQLVLKDGDSFLQDRHLAAIEQAREESTLLLRNFYKVWSEEIFLDMFEDEYQEMKKRPLNVEYLMMDANLLLPPTGTPMSGVEFHKRLPCGEVEGARRAIRVFFILRELSLTLRGEPETQLPLTHVSSCIRVHDVLDLNNSDIIGCTVVTKDGQKIRGFMVVEVLQIILVEPDAKRIGWGVAKFVGFLQDIEVGGDKDDSKCLYVTIHRHGSAASGNNRTPILAARFDFEDHIRCLAAKQRLTKGRLKARQRKMHQIARLLDLPDNVQPCPSPLRHSLKPVRDGDLQAGIQRSQSQDANLRVRSSSAGGAHGLHRPMFGATSKVPGFATAVRNEQTGSGQSSDSVARSTGSPSGTRRRVSSSTRSRDSSPRQQIVNESEEIPLEDLSQSRGSRHNSPMMRRHTSSGLPQARISAPPALAHISQNSPPSSPKIHNNSDRPIEDSDFSQMLSSDKSCRTLCSDQLTLDVASVHNAASSPKTLRLADTPKVSLLATAEEEEDAAVLGRLRPVPPNQNALGGPPSGSSSDVESPPPVCTKACCMLETSFMEKQLPGHGSSLEDDQSSASNSNADAAAGGADDAQSITSDMFAVQEEDFHRTAVGSPTRTATQSTNRLNNYQSDHKSMTDGSNSRTSGVSTKKAAHKLKGAIQTV